MQSRIHRVVLLSCLVFGALTASALAQAVTETPLRGNPYRQVGGSCVYWRNGELLNQPKGVVCPTQEKAPGASAQDSSEKFKGLPPQLRAEANALVASHDHVAEHLIELRRAVALNDKTTAIAISDEIAKELIYHLAREQALFEKVAAENRTH